MSSSTGCDWSVLSPDVLFLHTLSWVDSPTFFHQLPRVSKRWRAAQDEERWFTPGSQWMDSIANRLRLSASQLRAWQSGSMDIYDMTRRTISWHCSPPHDGCLPSRDEFPQKAGAPTLDELRLSCGLLWRAGCSLRCWLLLQQGVGQRAADGVRGYYEVPLALHQYCLDWVTGRELPNCFTAGEQTELEEEQGWGYRSTGLVWERRNWWTSQDLTEQPACFWDDGSTRHLQQDAAKGSEADHEEEEEDEEEEVEEEEEEEEEKEEGGEEEEKEAGRVADSDAMLISSDSDSNVPQQPAARLEHRDCLGFAGPPPSWLDDDCPLLQITCLMQCSCFHASAYPRDSEFTVTGVWTGPLPDMDIFDLLYADVDFTGEEAVVAERCLQAEAALSQRLQLNHGETSRCSECATSPIVGAMFVGSDDSLPTLCQACFYQQPRTVACGQQAGYVVSLQSWLTDTERHTTYQPSTLDDSPLVDFFPDRPPRLNALSMRDLFLMRAPSGAAVGGGASKAARAALEAWLQDEVAVDSEQRNWSRYRMYGEPAGGEEQQEDEDEKKHEENAVHLVQQRRRLAVGRLLPVYWQAVLDEAFTAARQEWHRMRDEEVADVEWRPTAAQKAQQDGDRESEGDSDDDADVQLQDGRDPLWDEADALDQEDMERLNLALAALSDDYRPLSAILETQLEILAGKCLKRQRESTEQQQQQEASSTKRPANGNEMDGK
jgi:hypothetical protein